MKIIRNLCLILLLCSCTIRTVPNLGPSNLKNVIGGPIFSKAAGGFAGLLGGGILAVQVIPVGVQTVRHIESGLSARPKIIKRVLLPLLGVSILQSFVFRGIVSARKWPKMAENMSEYKTIDKTVLAGSMLAGNFFGFFGVILASLVMPEKIPAFLSGGN